MFCTYCGKKFKPWKHGLGKRNHSYTVNYSCPDCHGIDHPAKDDRYCNTCGETLSNRVHTRIFKGEILFIHRHSELCPNCPPVRRFDYTQWANGLCRIYPEKVEFLSECPCKDVKKINHHPSYLYPFVIKRVCHKHHVHEHRIIRTTKKLIFASLLIQQAEHKRLRDLAKSAQAEAI